MEKITSFTINHLKLLSGLYVSRVDRVGDGFVTTFDIRMTRPYKEKTMSTGGMHAIEHLGATFLRNDEIWKDKVIYFGPMGCRTGFYMVLAGKLSSNDAAAVTEKMFRFIASFDAPVPGASERDCGNCYDMSLDDAHKYAEKYLREVFDEKCAERFTYPD